MSCIREPWVGGPEARASTVLAALSRRNVGVEAQGCCLAFRLPLGAGGSLEFMLKDAEEDWGSDSDDAADKPWTSQTRSTAADSGVSGVGQFGDAFHGAPEFPAPPILQ
jgi:hypothetical protein